MLDRNQPWIKYVWLVLIRGAENKQPGPVLARASGDVWLFLWKTRSARPIYKKATFNLCNWANSDSASEEPGLKENSDFLNNFCIIYWMGSKQSCSVFRWEMRRCFVCCRNQEFFVFTRALCDLSETSGSVYVIGLQWWLIYWNVFWNQISLSNIIHVCLHLWL